MRREKIDTTQKKTYNKKENSTNPNWSAQFSLIQWSNKNVIPWQKATTWEATHIKIQRNTISWYAVDDDPMIEYLNYWVITTVVGLFFCCRCSDTHNQHVLHFQCVYERAYAIQNATQIFFNARAVHRPASTTSKLNMNINITIIGAIHFVQFIWLLVFFFHHGRCFHFNQ